MCPVRNVTYVSGRSHRKIRYLDVPAPSGLLAKNLLYQTCTKASAFSAPRAASNSTSIVLVMSMFAMASERPASWRMPKGREFEKLTREAARRQQQRDESLPFEASERPKWPHYGDHHEITWQISWAALDADISQGPSTGGRPAHGDRIPRSNVLISGCTRALVVLITSRRKACEFSNGRYWRNADIRQIGGVRQVPMTDDAHHSSTTLSAQ